MSESEVKKIVDMTGMWWPDADSGNLRQVANAWRAMATAIDDATAPANKAAQTVISGNHGPAIDAFTQFWQRYYNGGTGALPDTAQACRQLADACDQFADEVDKAVHRLEEEATILGATLVAGTALAFFTAGLSEAAAATASASIVAAAEGIGVTVSATVADIAATTLTGVAFGAVESVAVDGLVAQPVRMAFGDGGFSGTELLSAAETGGIAGGITGGLGSAAQNTARVAGAAENLSPVLANIATRLPTALDSLPGRMVIGAGMGAGQDALFGDGTVNPLDVAVGAVGGAAGKGLSRASRDSLVPEIMGRPQNVTEEQFQALSATLKEKFAGIDGDILVQGSRAGYFAHAPQGGKPASDIDIMVRVSPKEFDRILAESYSKPPNPGSARERSYQYSQQTRIIKAGEVKLSDWKGQLSLSKWRDQVLVPTVNRPIDLSIVQRDSPFDSGPRMPIR